MHTHQVCLPPRTGNPAGNITVTVLAYSEGEASRIVASRNPSYTVEAVHRRG
jgi:hypothetical protein